MKLGMYNTIFVVSLVGGLGANHVTAFAISNHDTVSQQTASKFKDVKADHYAYESIQWAQGRGIVNGYPDGKFGPDNHVTEAQFVKMITKYFGINDSYGNIKKKTTETHWSDYGYDALAQYAIPLNGYFDNTLRDKPIKRGLVAQVLTNIAGYRADLSDSIQFLLDNGITTGQNPQYKNTDLSKYFGVTNNLTRAQVVTFLYRMETEGLNSVSESIEQPNGRDLTQIATLGKERVDSVLSIGTTPVSSGNGSIIHTVNPSVEIKEPTYAETRLPIKNDGRGIIDEANKRFFAMLNESTIKDFESKGFSIIYSDTHSGFISIDLDNNNYGITYGEDNYGISLGFTKGQETLGAKYVNDIFGTTVTAKDFTSLTIGKGKSITNKLFIQISGSGYIISYNKVK